MVLPMFDATTIAAVQRGGVTALAGDGQVTFGESTIMKHKAVKVRSLFHGRILAGFAGGAADAFTLFEKFEDQLEKHQGQLLRSAVALAKEWRSDRTLRRLEALLLTADADRILLLSGSGDLIEPDEPVVAIGSGGPYAMSAAKALYHHTDMDAAAIARASLGIAADICIYTNHAITVLTLPAEGKTTQ